MALLCNTGEPRNSTPVIACMHATTGHLLSYRVLQISDSKKCLGQALFAAPEADAKKLLEDARTVCLKWFSSYMEVGFTPKPDSHHASWDQLDRLLNERAESKVRRR